MKNIILFMILLGIEVISFGCTRQYTVPICTEIKDSPNASVFVTIEVKAEVPKKITTETEIPDPGSILDGVLLKQKIEE